MRISIASDQAIFRRGLVSFLMAYKEFELVGQAQDEAEILQLCELVSPQILLLDLNRTAEALRELARRIGERWPHIRIVLLENVQESPLRPEAHNLGSLYTFSKDVPEEELYAALLHIGKNFPAGAVPAQVEQALEERQISPGQEAAAHSPLSRDRSRRQDRPLSKEILSRELTMAGKIQTDILPEKTPVIPGWEFAAILEPARETSGDFYDFIPLPNGNWGLVIADVTDKGMGAALFMALSSTLIRTYAARYPTLPALTMDVVNERLLSDTRGSMFITAIYAVLEPQIGRLRYVNAGHNPAYLLHTQKGKQVDRLSRTGMTLGVMEDVHWQQKIARLSAGDLLLLYTDGITEAQNRQGMFFGEQRLLEVLRSKSDASAGEVQQAVLNEVHNFVGDSPRQDDIALIVVRHKK